MRTKPRQAGIPVAYGVGAILLAGAVAALYLFNPSEHLLFPPCPFHLLTRQHCPGCGSLRAVHNLLHGRWAAAMSSNPLLVISIPVVGLALLHPKLICRRWVPRAAMVVMVAYGVIRNLPAWPFTLLAPH